MLPASTVRWLVFALLAVVALVALFDKQQLAPTEEKPGQQTTALATTSDLANKPSPPPRGNFDWDSIRICSKHGTCATEMAPREAKEKRCDTAKQTRKHLTSRL